MNEESDVLPPARWTDWVLFLLAVSMVGFVVAMWTISYPVDLAP